MTPRHVSRLIPVLVACLCSGLLSARAHAERPPATVRFFFEILPLDQECQDWEAESSQRIVAHKDPGLSGQMEVFGVPDNISHFDSADYLIFDDDDTLLLDLRNTSWVRTPVVHVTAEGVESVAALGTAGSGSAATALVRRQDSTATAAREKAARWRRAGWHIGIVILGFMR